MRSPSEGEEVREVGLAEALGERYLAYALSTIVARSLPDVRDGLKPVHRRLLYAMRQLRLDPDRGFKKCARVVGDVIGKYHPHGDTAVYDAMVRLAQDFAVRYPLVEGQGNFGNIDGDNPAAMRYTEARLTAYALALMEGLDEDAVDFRPTYDGEESEPVVFPGAVPNLLANGAAGIAVGMATNVPPHNVGEICAALKHLLADPEASVGALMGHLPGPDFPTGGVLVEDAEALRAAYETGRGSLRLRARWRVEKLSHGLYHIIIDEVPYQVQKARLIERIAELINSRKLPILADVRDESTETVRMVLEPRSRTVDPEVLMEHLFRQTDLEVRFGLNMNLLDADGIPRVMDLKAVLAAFLDHRLVVLRRRAEHRLGRIAHRLEVLDGYLVAYLNLDEVIRIIRFEDHPRAELIRTFELTEVQADAILNMRLRNLRKLEEMEIKGEHERLSAEQADLQALLADPTRQRAEIGRQIDRVAEQFGGDTDLGRRRTELAAAPEPVSVPVEALIEREPITIILSRMGWLRAVKGHQDLGPDDLRFKDGDDLAQTLHASTVDKVLVFASTGRFYTLGADRIPRGRGFGEPVRLMVDLPNDAEVVALLVHVPGRRLLLAGSAGRGFLVREDEVLAQTRTGRQVLNVGQGRATHCLPAEGDHVAVIGDNRKLLVFPLDEVAEMARGQGVILQKYRDGGLKDLKVFTLAEGLTYQRGSQSRTETDLTPWLGRRAGVGRLPPTGFPRSGCFG
ncbi:DNA topoisomerase IV subunit A [Roseospirillum parvum]|uniref:DNA topoisomerase 4 subunit A n=1 Tax=Roseospirillum parvum TaxID=83401 RepID=A0A1G7YL44_9PROT|nr:DNA topoisomerase IV subunit A [Roseospirillum parvum]SDG97015.1 topoisomerase-4 subunit A [Roseospirillum parvum]